MRRLYVLFIVAFMAMCGCKKQKDEFVIIQNIMVQTEDIGSSDHATAKKMCMHSNVGGYTDWRLPTIAELAMMYEKRDYIGNFKNNKYWSSDKDYDDDYYYFIVDFINGSIGSSWYEYQHSVRAVRTVIE